MTTVPCPRPSPVLRRALGAVAVVVGLVAAAASPAAAAPTAANADTFQSGTFATGRWTTTNAALQQSWGGVNTFAHLASTGSTATLYWGASVIEQRHRYWTLRAWVRVGPHPANQSVDMASVKNGGGVNHADLFTDPATGHCRVDLLWSDTALSAKRCDDSAWHLLELRGDFGTTTYTLDWRVDGVAQPSIKSTGRTASGVYSAWLGEGVPDKTAWVDVDDVALTVGDAPLGFLGATPKPLG